MRKIIFAICFIIIIQFSSPSMSEESRSSNPESIPSEIDSWIIEQDDIVEDDIMTGGEPVIVKGTAKKNIAAFGADVTVEGLVEGDVITIGGNIFVRDGGLITGDAIAGRQSGQSWFVTDDVQNIAFFIGNIHCKIGARDKLIQLPDLVGGDIQKIAVLLEPFLQF